MGGADLALVAEAKMTDKKKIMRINQARGEELSTNRRDIGNFVLGESIEECNTFNPFTHGRLFDRLKKLLRSKSIDISSDDSQQIEKPMVL